MIVYINSTSPNPNPIHSSCSLLLRLTSHLLLRSPHPLMRASLPPLPPPAPPPPTRHPVTSSLSSPRPDLELEAGAVEGRARTAPLTVAQWPTLHGAAASTPRRDDDLASPPHWRESRSWGHWWGQSSVGASPPLAVASWRRRRSTTAHGGPSPSATARSCRRPSPKGELLDSATTSSFTARGMQLPFFSDRASPSDGVTPISSDSDLLSDRSVGRRGRIWGPRPRIRRLVAAASSVPAWRQARRRHGNVTFFKMFVMRVNMVHDEAGPLP